MGYSSAGVEIGSSGVEILHMLSTSVSTLDEVYAYAEHIQNICILPLYNAYFLFSY